MSNVPPPRASPRVPRDIDDGRDEPVTGAYPATRAYARHVGRMSVLKALVAAVVAIVSSTAGAVLWVQHLAAKQARDEVEIRVGPVEIRVGGVEQRMTAVEQWRGFTTGDMHEVQLDVRELYRVGRTKERSARLEEPLPLVSARDGGGP